jgi:DNA-binding FadR family transcriptional regulator
VTDEPISRDTLVDALVVRLQREIMAGRFPPGTYLPPERDLAAAYAVTRTSLKHALTKLAQLGLIETKHGVGTRVRDYLREGGPELLPLLVATHGGDWLTEIFEVRREVGALVAARAAVHRSSAHQRLLREQVAGIGGAATADGAQLVECELHRTLAEASGNRVYGFMVNSLLNSYLPVRALLVAPFLDPAAAADRIRPVVEAVCAGDREEARDAATRYLIETERLMLESD